MIYISSNTSTQIIDTFDLPTTHSVQYSFQISSNSDLITSELYVVHDGVNSYETQSGTSLSGNKPFYITSNVSSFVGNILATPAEANTTFAFNKNITACNLYSENTQSGKLIQGSEGISFDSYGNLTLRQSNNNFYGASNTYLIANTFGPITTLSELLLNNTFNDTSEWQSYNYSTLYVSNNIATAISSGQTDNHQYQCVNVIPGQVYSLVGVASLVNPYIQDLKENAYRSQGSAFIRVGISENLSKYGNYQVPLYQSAFTLMFTPNETSVIVSFGYGDRSAECIIELISLKQTVPFHTFNQTQGTFYLNWNSVSANSLIAVLSPQTGNTRTVYIDGSNNVCIVDGSVLTIGAQTANNRLVYSYSNSGIAATLNGNSVVSINVTPTEQLNSLYFASTMNKFSYTSSVLSNTQMISLSYD